MSRKIYKPYCSHDYNARVDSKIKDMFYKFRYTESESIANFIEKIKKDEHLLGQVSAWAAYGIFWGIVENMHQDDFKDSKLKMYADDFRIDANLLEIVLKEFNLFRLEDENYISDRVLRNIQEQEAKSEKARQSANKKHSKKPADEPKHNEISANDVFVAEVVQIYKDNFNDSKIVSNSNKEKIAEISNSEQLKLEDWQKIFQNAKRGWNYPDGKHVKPSLKKILEEWDSFHRGDNGLAPEKIDESAILEQKRIQKEAGEKLDSGLDTEFFIYDEYRCALNTVKLQAQQAYKENLSDGEDAAIKAMRLSCREAVQNA